MNTLEYGRPTPRRPGQWLRTLSKIALAMVCLFVIGVVSLWLFATYYVFPASLNQILSENFSTTLPAGAFQADSHVVVGEYGTVFYRVRFPHGTTPSFIAALKATATQKSLPLSFSKTSGFTYHAPDWYESGVPAGSEEIDAEGGTGPAELSWSPGSDDVYIRWGPW